MSGGVRCASLLVPATRRRIVRNTPPFIVASRFDAFSPSVRRASSSNGPRGDTTTTSDGCEASRGRTREPRDVETLRQSMVVTLGDAKAPRSAPPPRRRRGNASRCTKPSEPEVDVPRALMRSPPRRALLLLELVDGVRQARREAGTQLGRVLCTAPRPVCCWRCWKCLQSSLMRTRPRRARFQSPRRTSPRRTRRPARRSWFRTAPRTAHLRPRRLDPTRAAPPRSTSSCSRAWADAGRGPTMNPTKGDTVFLFWFELASVSSESSAAAKRLW